MARPPATRVTIRDIAKAAGVHFTTVSLALRGSSQLPVSTRDRIRDIAEQLGYRPDPMLSALNVYRRSRRPPRFQATLAWINNWPEREALHRNECFGEYFEGARMRAEKMGYLLEEFWLAERGMTPERLNGILKARNIDGILLAPQPAPRMFPALDFSNLAVVSLGYSLQPSVFHVVTNHHFHSMSLMLDRLRELGYRRIGFFGEEQWDDKVEHGWIGGLALARWRDPSLCDIPPLLEGNTRDRDLTRWLRANRPDVVISYSAACDWLRRLGCEIPAKIGFASLSLDQGNTELSGLYQNNIRIGETAVDFLISMLHSGERGIPRTPTRVLVESEWMPGTTLSEQLRSVHKRGKITSRGAA
jgi:DNA-binding LacI/PurR family transcriptional regulator